MLTFAIIAEKDLHKRDQAPDHSSPTWSGPVAATRCTREQYALLTASRLSAEAYLSAGGRLRGGRDRMVLVLLRRLVSQLQRLLAARMAANGAVISHRRAKPPT